jgi:hypothetical protein
LIDADAPTYTCAPSLLCHFLAQGPYSPSLGSSQSLEPPKRQSIIQAIQETLLFLLISVDFMQGVARQLSKLGDVLIHKQGPLFQILKLLLLYIDNSLGNIMMRTSILWLQSFLPLRYLALTHDHEHNN